MFFFSNKKSLAESDFFNGYIENHCHLLPGVDDGVQTEKETIRILQQMEQLGVKEVWLTPHIMEDNGNTPQKLKLVFEQLTIQYNKCTHNSDIIKLHLAAEYMLDSGFERWLKDDNILPHRNGTLLVETSYFNPPYAFHAMLDKIRSIGLFPLLAHPERYEYMDDNDYSNLKDKGTKFQLNVPSLLGFYGHTAQKKAQRLLDKGWYDAVGFDIHSEHAFTHIVNSKLKTKDIEKITNIGALL